MGDSPYFLHFLTVFGICAGAVFGLSDPTGDFRWLGIACAGVLAIQSIRLVAASKREAKGGTGVTLFKRLTDGSRLMAVGVALAALSLAIWGIARANSPSGHVGSEVGLAHTLCLLGAGVCVLYHFWFEKPADG